MNKKTSEPSLLTEILKRQTFHISINIFMYQLKGKKKFEIEIDCDPKFYLVNVLAVALAYWLKANMLLTYSINKCGAYALQNFKFQINDYQQNSDGSVAITATAIETEN